MKFVALWIVSLPFAFVLLSPVWLVCAILDTYIIGVLSTVALAFFIGWVFYNEEKMHPSTSESCPMPWSR